jgi:hypothetical protein
MICLIAFAAQSQNSTQLDSNELRQILHIVNERNYYKSLDTINRVQIEELNESIKLYDISLETCEKTVDNREITIVIQDEELDQTKNALDKESKRVKKLTKTLWLIPIAFFAGLIF